MDQERVSKLIKDLRTKSGLTQKDFAEKYGVTFQAVSKWETGKNIPDISLLKQIAEDFGISIDDFLDGRRATTKKNKWVFILLGCLIIGLVIGIVVLILNNNNSYEFKTLSTTCDEFSVSGSIAYDNKKSSIYISNVNYCGGNDTTTYSKIECNLYETYNNTEIRIGECAPSQDNSKLEDYLKNVSIEISDYEKTCKNYTDESLYLKINAYDKNGKVILYNIPLKLGSNCK